MRGRSLAASLIAALLLLVSGSALAAKYDSSGREVVALGTALACERNTDVANNGYCVVYEDWNGDAVDLATDSTTVSPVPARLGCIVVTAALSAHDFPIKDGTTTKCVVPASAQVGTTWCGCKGTRFDVNLTADPNDAATGTAILQWRPQ
ncbi:MAG: hypothetical protein AB7Q29_19870 [Vicinamibacterales bacterium]